MEIAGIFFIIILALGVIGALSVLCASLFSLVLKSSSNKYQAAASTHAPRFSHPVTTPYPKDPNFIHTETTRSRTRRFGAAKTLVVVTSILAFLRVTITIIAFFASVPGDLLSFLEIATKCSLYTALIVLKRQFFPAHKKGWTLVVDIALIVATVGLGLATFILSILQIDIRNYNANYILEGYGSFSQWGIADYVALAYAAWMLVITVGLSVVLVWKIFRAKREGAGGLEYSALRKLTTIVIPIMAVSTILVIVSTILAFTVEISLGGTLAILMLAFLAMVVGDVIMLEAMRRAILKLEAVSDYERV